MDVWQRRRQVLGRGLAGGLVFRVGNVPLRRRFGVESNRKMGRLLLAENVEQGLGETIEGGTVQPFGREDGSRDESEMGSVHESHSVEQEQSLHHGVRVTRMRSGWREDFSQPPM